MTKFNYINYEWMVMELTIHMTSAITFNKILPLSFSVHMLYISQHTERLKNILIKS